MVFATKSREKSRIFRYGLPEDFLSKGPPGLADGLVLLVRLAAGGGLASHDRDCARSLTT